MAGIFGLDFGTTNSVAAFIQRNPDKKGYHANVLTDRQGTLYAHEKLVAEFNKQPRLQTKFVWFRENDYVQNRRLSITPGRKEQAAIDETYGYMWPEAQAMFPLISPTDVRILATAAELEYRMVTDDQDLYKLAEMYGVHVTSSLELMRLMLDEGHINKDMVERVVAQWEYDEDKPANFRGNYIKLFGSAPPKE